MPLTEKPSERGFLYAISNGHNAVKIGVAKNVRSRYHNLNSSSPHPMIVRGYVRIDRDHERDILEELSDARIRLEWFREDHPKVQDLLKFLVGPPSWERKKTWKIQNRGCLAGASKRAKERAMFATTKFLEENFQSPERVRAYLRLYKYEVPKYDTVYGWFRRNSMPSQVLAELLTCLEIERGKPLNMSDYVEQSA